MRLAVAVAIIGIKRAWGAIETSVLALNYKNGGKECKVVGNGCLEDDLNGRKLFTRFHMHASCGLVLVHIPSPLCPCYAGQTPVDPRNIFDYALLFTPNKPGTIKRPLVLNSP